MGAQLGNHSHSLLERDDESLAELNSFGIGDEIKELRHKEDLVTGCKD